MRVASLGLFALLTLLTATAVGQPASKDPKDLILGKWVMTEKKDGAEFKAAMEFTKDACIGTVSIKLNDKEPAIERSFDAKYKWVGDDNSFIEMTAQVPGDPKSPGGDAKAPLLQTEKVRVKVTDKELTVSGKDMKEMRFTRSK